MKNSFLSFSVAMLLSASVALCAMDGYDSDIEEYLREAVQTVSDDESYLSAPVSGAGIESSGEIEVVVPEVQEAPVVEVVSDVSDVSNASSAGGFVEAIVSDNGIKVPGDVEKDMPAGDVSVEGNAQASLFTSYWQTFNNRVVEPTCEFVCENHKPLKIVGFSTGAAVVTALATKVYNDKTGKNISKKKAALIAWVSTAVATTGYYYGPDMIAHARALVARNF